MSAKPLIQSGKVAAKSAGKYDLTLQADGGGWEEGTQRASRSIRLKLSVTFLPWNGKAANRILDLTLTR